MEYKIVPKGSNDWTPKTWEVFNKKFDMAIDVFPNKVYTALANSMEYSRGVIITKHMSGPRPSKLGVVTGRGRTSIHWTVVRKASLYTAEIGTNVWYLKLHEKGMTVDVKGSQTKLTVNRGGGKKEQVKVFIKPHKRTYKKRAMLKKGLKESLPFIKKELNNVGLIFDFSKGKK